MRVYVNDSGKMVHIFHESIESIWANGPADIEYGWCVYIRTRSGAMHAIPMATKAAAQGYADQLAMGVDGGRRLPVPSQELA